MFLSMVILKIFFMVNRFIMFFNRLWLYSMLFEAFIINEVFLINFFIFFILIYIMKFVEVKVITIIVYVLSGVYFIFEI